MKIAMFGHKRIPSREGGVEIVVEELAKREAALGNEITVYNRLGHHVSGSKFDSQIKSDDLKNIKIKTVFTFENSKLNAIVYSILSAIKVSFSNCDVVHIHAEGPASMSFLPKLFGKKVIVTIHGLDWQRSKWGSFATKFLKYGEKNAVKYADEIIVLSKNTQKYFSDTYGRKTVYIPNAVNKPEIKKAEKIKELYNLDKNSYILFLGRIVPEKQVSLLVEAYNHIDTNKKLVIAGGVSANSLLRRTLAEECKKRDWEMYMPEKSLCGDNAAMVGSQGYYEFLSGNIAGTDLNAFATMSIEKG